MKQVHRINMPSRYQTRTVAPQEHPAFSGGKHAPVYSLKELPPKSRNLNRYTLENYIAGGGFSDVYTAKRRRQRRARGWLGPSLYAVKVCKIMGEKPERQNGDSVPSKLTHTGSRFESVYKETEICKRLQHKRHIVRVFDAFWGAYDEIWIAMELLATDLYRVLNETKVGLRQIAAIASEVALGLDHIHRSGFVHMDIKLRNIMLSNDGYIKIGDFGLAKPMHCTIGEANMSIGTSGYVAPEVLCMGTHDKLDGRSDVWALGVVLYKLLYNGTELNFGSAESFSVETWMQYKESNEDYYNWIFLMAPMNFNPTRTEQHCVDFIKQCLVPLPNNGPSRTYNRPDLLDRPTPVELQQLDFVSSCGDLESRKSLVKRILKQFNDSRFQGPSEETFTPQY